MPVPFSSPCRSHAACQSHADAFAGALRSQPCKRSTCHSVNHVLKWALVQAAYGGKRRVVWIWGGVLIPHLALLEDHSPTLRAGVLVRRGAHLSKRKGRQDERAFNSHFSEPYRSRRAAGTPRSSVVRNQRIRRARGFRDANIPNLSRNFLDRTGVGHHTDVPYLAVRRALQRLLPGVCFPGGLGLRVVRGSGQVVCAGSRGQKAYSPPAWLLPFHRTRLTSKARSELSICTAAPNGCPSARLPRWLPGVSPRFFG